MEEQGSIERDLFGEPVPVSVTRRGRKAKTPYRSSAAIEEVANDSEPPEVHLHLPAALSIDGSMARNPIRQFARRAGTQKGTLEPFALKRLRGFRFRSASGESAVIVSKKTLTAVAGEPVLLVPGADTPEAIQDGLARGLGVWLSPRPAKPAVLPAEEARAACTAVMDSWRGQFSFREGVPATDATPQVPGLRKPQVGALHAALAHVTSSVEPATIVMPTGTGKTETMLAIYAHERFERLMVVVPTDALRDQIAGKFETMGVLQDQLCLPMSIRYPVVLRLEHIPKSRNDVDELFARANVVVTTMAIAGRAMPEVQERMAQMCGALFIDEAHHIKAKTWRAFRAWFAEAAAGKLIFQFTATPFREDGGKVDGKFIYYYPLAKAQSEDYFGKIAFRAVSDLDGDEADDEIMRLVGETLDRDLAAGLSHLAMVRCKKIARAKHLHERYARELGRYNPVIVHSDQSDAERRQNLAKLRRFESRIIVCVDMLGEGFDLPELKIAGVHDVFASVAVTLQFVGRFARARTDLGIATVIANTDQDRVDRALAKLYAEEADWNILISTINSDRVGREMGRAEVFAGFNGELREIPLQTIEPTMSTLVFRTEGCEQWDPHKIEDTVPHGSFVGMKLNQRERIAVCILRHEQIAKWTTSATATDVTWELVLAHWDDQTGLLYISSTGGSATDGLAKTICGGQTTRIRGQTVFRCFHDFNQLVIRNLGMTHRQGGGTRYSMLMGIDVSDGIDSLMKSERIQNNIFGSGFEDGEPRTLGCSIKGKFWSQPRVHDLTDWTGWCHRIGALLDNDSIPESAAFASAMRPKSIIVRPDAHPLVIHWPMSLLLSFEERIEIAFGGNVYPFAECELVLASNARTGPLRFEVRAHDKRAEFEIGFTATDATYTQIGGPACRIKTPRHDLPIAEFFADDAPQIDFGDGSFLIYSHLYVPPKELDLAPILDHALIPWDWAGINRRIESQGPERRTDSVQYRVIQELKKSDYDIIFDDDGTGEFADVIAIKVREAVVDVLMCHCKFAGTDTGAARLEDLYEVAGQALKSVQFCHKPKRFLRNMINRERRRLDRGESTRFDRGTLGALRQLYARWDQYRFEYKVWIVQPGLSKKAASQPILQLLGFVEKALIDHRRIPLTVIVRE
ncbi:DEAD/DEAH box helicase family protein [Mesorhizobium sp.]|uniref:DEAD/DEAH box helicase n=1 Tax=Mesorhizobium sp. TaxID=1871066 RepID=UPI0025D7523B|nr:DEAD/DEAH box helicase family protein [Mesorhizobium sp.]